MKPMVRHGKIAGIQGNPETGEPHENRESVAWRVPMATSTSVWAGIGGRFEKPGDLGLIFETASAGRIGLLSSGRRRTDAPLMAAHQPS